VSGTGSSPFKMGGAGAASPGAIPRKHRAGEGVVVGVGLRVREEEVGWRAIAGELAPRHHPIRAE